MVSIAHEREPESPAMAGAHPYGMPDAGPFAYSSGVHLAEEIWAAVKSHIFLILGILSVALLVGVVATLMTTPAYKANVRMEILPSSPVDTSVGDKGFRFGGNDLAFYNTQYALMASRSLADRVVRAGNLTADKEFLTAFKMGDPEAGAGGGQRKNLAGAAAARLMGSVSVVPVRSSSLVDIGITTSSPQLSAKLADLWATQYIEASIDRRFGATSDARQYLEAKLAAQRQSLEDSERAMINYATANDIITISTSEGGDGKTQTQKTLISSEIEAISLALSKAREERIAASADLNNTMSGNAQSNVLAISGLRAKRAEVAGELARLRTIFGEDYPAIVSLRAELASLDRNITTESGRTTAGNREAYNSALQKETQLKAELDRLTGAYNGQQRRSIQFAILQREVDSNRQLYDGLLQKFKAIGAEGIGTNNISVVESAIPPGRPSSPNLYVNLFVALLAGLILSAIAIFALEKLDSTIRDPQVVDKRFGMPMLGAVPEIEDVDLTEAIRDKKSATYEAYFSIMTNLTFMTAHGAPRSLMLTSSRPKEGKSNSALCLATVFAASGKSVVLVDADVRNPSVNRYLQVDNKRGLSHYLTGDDDLQGIIAHVPDRGFSVITAGKTPPNAAELLGLDRFGAMIKQLTEQFDHVIIDSPPVLGLADAPLIARQVEGVLFTIQANETKNRAITTSLSRLAISGARIFGAIVTKVGAKNQVYGYGQGYGYGYGYGPSKEEG